MKKFLAILLAAMMLLSVASVAMADEYTDAATKTFSKNYELNGDETAISPAETFVFGNVSFVSATDTGVGYTEAWAKDNLPTIDSVSYEKGEAGSAAKAKNFTITLPTYEAVGIYEYTFTEVDNNTAGVTYRTTPVRLVVTVINGDDGFIRVAAVHCEEENGTKTGSFDNTYSAGKLSVEKKVEGNLGDKNKDFDITVKFTAPAGDTVKSDITYNDGTTTDTVISAGDGWTTKEVTIHVKDSETVTFTNIPAGVTYEIVETDAAVQAGADGKAEYTVTYDDNKTGTVSGNETVATIVTNTKTGTIDTGVVLDTLPYVLVLAVVGAAVIAMIAKKRNAED